MLGRTVFALGLAFSGSMWAQAVISAHSGVIQLTEGTVELDGTAVQSPARLGEFQDVKSGQTLTTKDGDAEILLTPGVFLRLAENSSFKMVSNKLTDTRVEVLSGTAMLQVGELLPDNAITVMYHNADIELSKRGLYRIDSAPEAKLRVYDGEAKVTSGDMSPVGLRKGREVVFGGDKLEAKNFDMKETDAFYRWNERRDQYVAQANITSARTAGTSGSGSGSGFYSGGMTSMAGYNGYGPGMGSWMFNPWFGMFTFMPYTGMYYSPFGYGYYSPFAVGSLYMPGSPYYMGGIPAGYGGVTRAGTPTTVTSGLLGAGTRGSLGTGSLRGAGPLGGGIGSNGTASSSSSGGIGSGSSGGGMAGGGSRGGAGGRH
jgi:hypothetical protein